MGRTWEHVFSYDPVEEDTEHLIVEYRPGGGITFIAHDPDPIGGAVNGTVELVNMPWAAFLEMFAAMERHHAHDEDAEPCEDMRCRPCAWHARKDTR